MNRTLVIGFFIMLASIHLQGQDIHFSQFGRSPLILNPAMTGGFPAVYRLGVQYRDQWSSFESPFRTFSAFMDARIINNRIVDGGCETVTDFFGVGGYFYSDQAGDANLTATSGMLTMAYHKQLSSSLYGAFGVAGGFGSKRIDRAGLQLISQWQETYFSGDLPEELADMDEAFSYFDFHAGIFILDSVSKNGSIWLGSSLNHINVPRNGFMSDTTTIPWKVNVHGGGGFSSDKWQYHISMLWTTQDRFQQFIVNFGGAYRSRDSEVKLKKSKVEKYSEGLRVTSYTLIGGIGVRLLPVRDIIPMIGIEIKRFCLTMTYDISFINKHIRNPYSGGFEIALTKQF